MKYIILYDERDPVMSYLVLQVNSNLEVTGWSTWANSLNSSYLYNVNTLNEDEKINFKQISSQFTKICEAESIEELKLLVLLEN